jgi:cytosine/adenosine deaminase-related metal-dependent hydrolase
LKDRIPEHTGIGGFVKEINRSRNTNLENLDEIIRKTDRKMWAEGIAAVGDISNSNVTISTKTKSKIHYHTFVESFGFHPSRAEKSFSIAKTVQREFAEKGLKASIVPHAPYSVSEPLFNSIKENARSEKSILSIHNQESRGEAQFYLDGTGPIVDHLQHNLGIDISHWKPTGKSSLAFILNYFPSENQLLLVHNTFTEKEDIDELKKHRDLGNTHFVLCPLSNLYIENQLPPVDLFQQENLNICLGTDSLASNHQLSVLAEMIALQQHFPHIKLEELIQWACLNGAKALNIENRFGSFEKGKNPGINVITGIELKSLKLTEKSRVKRLV